jgi:tRNA-guanine family transglycosylase
MACKRYTRAYFHNLVTKGIATAAILVTYHNVAYMQNLTRRMRVAIKVRARASLYPLPQPPSKGFDVVYK